MRMLGLRHTAIVVEQRNIGQLRQRDQARAHAVINVMRVVGNFVGQIAQLRLQAGLLLAQKSPPHASRFIQLQPLRVCLRAMFEHALPRFEGQVDAVVIGVALFKVVHHPQALQVVLEPAMGLHAPVQRILPGVPERGVAEVMGQRDRLHQVFVDAQRPGNRTPQLRHLQRMREPRAKQISLVVQKNLGLVNQPTECRRMHDAVTVTLVVVARGRCRLRVAAPARKRRVAGIARQRRALGQIGL